MSCVDFQLLAAGVAVSTMRREKGTEVRVFTTVEHHKTQARDDVLLFHGQSFWTQAIAVQTFPSPERGWHQLCTALITGLHDLSKVRRLLHSFAAVCG
jgi:hypothetical protein